VKKLVAGIDSGNSKTAFVCLTVEGETIARGLAPASNYQTLGAEGCLGRLRGVVEPLAAAMRSGAFELAGFGFGLAGLDRVRDLDVLDAVTLELVRGICGPGHEIPPRILLNDAFLTLRAGAEGGVGVAVSAGTSGNCVGMNHVGQRLQIGGIAAELGDGGGGFDIAIAGLKAAGRARDGRAPATLITDLYLKILGIDDIADVVDFMIPGAHLPEAASGVPMDIEQPIPPAIGMLAPLVFEAAAMGDIVARNILEGFGRDLGLSARVAAFRLGWRRDDRFPLVLGGSVLQKAEDQTFRNALVAEVASMYPEVCATVLADPPVAGAVMYGFDAAGICVTPEISTCISKAAGGLFE